MKTGPTRGALALALLLPAGAVGQSTMGPGASPDTLARGFQTALQAGAWEIAAELMHPEGLDRFRRLLRILAEADSSGAVEGTLLPDLEPGALTRLSPHRLFAHAAASLADAMPGVVHSLSAREVTVLGTVGEEPDRAHVVYRNRDLLQGAVPEIRVMTLRRGESGWRVLESDELGLIREALRGLVRTFPRSRLP